MSLGYDCWISGLLLQLDFRGFRTLGFGFCGFGGFSVLCVFGVLVFLILCFVYSGFGFGWICGLRSWFALFDLTVLRCFLCVVLV